MGLSGVLDDVNSPWIDFVKDSFDLFYALYKGNPNSSSTLKASSIRASVKVYAR